VSSRTPESLLRAEGGIAFTPVPTANPNRLASTCESGDIPCDARSPQVGLGLW